MWNIFFSMAQFKWSPLTICRTLGHITENRLISTHKPCFLKVLSFLTFSSTFKIWKFFKTIGWNRGKSNVNAYKEDVRNPPEVDVMVDLYCVPLVTLKLFFIVVPFFYDSGFRLATRGICAVAGRQK